MNVLIFDTESYAIDKASDYLKQPSAPANYKDPAVIAAFIEKANAEALAKAALDVDLARIVAIGVSDGTRTDVETAKNETEEAALLTAFWLRVTNGWSMARDNRPTLIGFNCIGWDLPLLLRRSLYLGVKAPSLQIGKYRHDGIIDLMLSLSYDGALKYRGLSFYAKRMALDVPTDEHSGADIAHLVAAGDWPAVSAHCRIDVQKTVALAKRMGVVA